MTANEAHRVRQIAHTMFSRLSCVWQWIVTKFLQLIILVIACLTLSYSCLLLSLFSRSLWYSLASYLSLVGCVIDFYSFIFNECMHGDLLLVSESCVEVDGELLPYRAQSNWLNIKVKTRQDSPFLARSRTLVLSMFWFCTILRLAAIVVRRLFCAPHRRVCRFWNIDSNYLKLFLELRTERDRSFDSMQQ